MGAFSSKRALDKALGPAFPESERVFGLENFGNTCYCNSVLQALYYCKPLREVRQLTSFVVLRAWASVSRIANLGLPLPVPQHCIADSLRRQEGGGGGDDDLLTCLCDLFHTISTQKRRCGVHPPRKFVAKLREENEVFNNQMHQDAHEFLNFLLNEAAEVLQKRSKKSNSSGGSGGSGGGGGSDGGGGGGGGGDGDDDDASGSGDDDEGAGTNRGGGSSGVDGGATSSSSSSAAKTWIHKIFEGVLTNETRCLACDSVTSRDESFLDLSLEIEQNSSVSACMRNFSASEASSRTASNAQ